MIPRETVFDLETRVRPGGKTKGALIGFLVGGAFGAVLGYSDGDDPPGIMSSSAGAKAGMGVILFAPLGAIFGALAAQGSSGRPFRPTTSMWVSAGGRGVRPGSSSRRGSRT